MLADLAEYAVYTADLSALERLLQSLEGDRDIAYAAVLDDQGRLIASRGYGDAAMPPAPAAELHPGAVESSVRQVRGGVISSWSHRSPKRRTSGRPRRRRRACCRSSDRLRAPGLELRAQSGALAQQRHRRIVGRRRADGDRYPGHAVAHQAAAVAPIRELMRAAKAVGAGDLGVRVKPTSGDELGMLTRAFNHMTQRLARVAGRGGELPAHARRKGRAADQGARDRDRAGVQACAA